MRKNERKNKRKRTEKEKTKAERRKEQKLLEGRVMGWGEGGHSKDSEKSKEIKGE